MCVTDIFFSEFDLHKVMLMPMHIKLHMQSICEMLYINIARRFSSVLIRVYFHLVEGIFLKEVLT
jgi:hypothetical protein